MDQSPMRFTGMLAGQLKWKLYHAIKKKEAERKNVSATVAQQSNPIFKVPSLEHSGRQAAPFRKPRVNFNLDGTPKKSPADELQQRARKARRRSAPDVLKEVLHLEHEQQEPVSETETGASAGMHPFKRRSSLNCSQKSVDSLVSSFDNVSICSDAAANQDVFEIIDSELEEQPHASAGKEKRRVNFKLDQIQSSPAVNQRTEVQQRARKNRRWSTPEVLEEYFQFEDEGQPHALTGSTTGLSKDVDQGFIANDATFSVKQPAVEQTEQTGVTERNPDDRPETPIDTGSSSQTAPFDVPPTPYDWLTKLANPNPESTTATTTTTTGDDDHQLTLVDRDLVLFTPDSLECQEQAGIRYSFYNSPSTTSAENFGYLRFAPHAEKKLSKAKNFHLKFLVLQGELVFEVDGREIDAKGGDFVMLSSGAKYLIRNGEQISVLFMIKYTPSS